jgi:hypothetical protein
VRVLLGQQFQIGRQRGIENLAEPGIVIGGQRVLVGGDIDDDALFRPVRGGRDAQGGKEAAPEQDQKQHRKRTDEANHSGLL